MPLNNINERQYRSALYENSPVGIAFFNYDSTIICVNHKFSETLGYSESELVGYSFERFVHPEDFKHDIKSISKLKTGEVKYYQTVTRFYTKYGIMIYCTTKTSVIEDEASGNDIMVIHVQPINDARFKPDQDQNGVILRPELNIGKFIADNWKWALSVVGIAIPLIWNAAMWYREINLKIESLEQQNAIPTRSLENTKEIDYENFFTATPYIRDEDCDNIGHFDVINPSWNSVKPPNSEVYWERLCRDN